MFRSAIVLASSLLVLGCAAPLAQQKEILFVVHGSQNSVEPVAFITAEGFIAVPDPCEPLQRNRLGALAKAGAKYPLYHRGSRAGEMTILSARKFDPQKEEEPPIYARLDSRVALTDEAPGLATNHRILDRAQMPQSEATRDQESDALHMARRLFGERGISASAIDRVQRHAVGLRSIQKGKPHVLGSFFIRRTDGAGLEASLFFIAQQGSSKPEHVFFHAAADEVQGVLRSLVDNLDFNGDGFDEVVLREAYYENYSYVILMRAGNGKWSETFRTPVYGCL